MKNATFYLLDSDSTVENINTAENGSLTNNTQPDKPLRAIELVACTVAAMHWRSGKRVLIACEDLNQAQRLDEALWQRDPAEFVPHNLAGEGPSYGAPVELCWPGKRGNSPRDILISLLPQCADFATAFHEVVDFVPHDETLKQLARDRYKAYRSVGFHLTTATPPTY